MSDPREEALADQDSATSGKPLSFADLQEAIRRASSNLQNIDTVRQSAGQNMVLTSRADDSETTYKHKEYFNQISAYERLREANVMRRISHNFAVERLWMLCESGQQSKTEKFVYDYCGKTYEWDDSVRTTKSLTNEEATTKFVDALKLDLQAQHDINVKLLEIDHTARKQYLEEQLQLVQKMVQQQGILIQSLNDWSHYMDQRADEYSQMYERLSVVINTTKRKDVFEVKDLRALDGWNRMLTSIFWVFVIVLLVMVVVQHYRELSAMAKQVKEKIPDLSARDRDDGVTPDEPN